MPMVDADGCRLNVRIDGPQDAPALMLSNSLGATLAMWEPQVAAFTRHFRLVRYDRRGHGGSDVPKGAYTMERLGRDALAILDGLGIAKAHWCGLSMGGMVGMWLGANAPERIDRLVLSNTAARFPSPDPWNDRIKIVTAKGLAPLGDLTMERWFTPAFREREPATVQRVLDQFLATQPDGYVGCCYAIRDMDQGESIGRITAPTLVIAGRQDPATTPEQAEFIRDRIPGAKLAMLDAAHLSNIEQAEAYNAAVLDHLLGR